jgi:Fe2+ or Zn2+ uptake regulation protein
MRTRRTRARIERPADGAERALRADLARRGLRLTAQRRLILGVVQATDVHPTAEWVHAAVRRARPRVSLATVYRNLRLLARQGLLAEIQWGGSLRFDARVPRHHHFTCSVCGRIFDLDEPVDARLEARVASRTGFHVADHRIEFFGVCRACARRRPRPRGR